MPFGLLSRASSSRTADSTSDNGSTTAATTSPSIAPSTGGEAGSLKGTSIGSADDSAALDDNVAVDSDGDDQADDQTGLSGVQETAEKGAEVTDQGKVKTLLGVLRRCLSVKDLSSVRISLPASLMDPVGNLEYWQYADRPDVLAAISGPDDELERFLAVVRFVFSKDLKFIKGKIAKPYNSILSEHFHAYWDTEPFEVDPTTGEPTPKVFVDMNPTPEVLANAGRKSAGKAGTAGDLPDLAQASEQAAAQPAADDKLSTRVAFLNEQTSHHPPISHYMFESRGPKGRVRCYGSDQLSAKFTGTNVKVYPGPHNKGIFVSLPDRNDEEYQITHPTAIVAGLLRGDLYATISSATFVNCVKTDAEKRYRAIIAYTEESWISKAKFAVEGVIYEVKSDSDMEWTKIKHVKQDQVVATLTGCWRGEVRIKFAETGEERVLIDMVPLAVQPKMVAPLSEQDETETRRVWEPVSKALREKDFGLASKNKQAIEQAQRDKASERKKTGEKYVPRFFEAEPDEIADWDGRPRLTTEGREALERMFKVNYSNSAQS